MQKTKTFLSTVVESLTGRGLTPLEFEKLSTQVDKCNCNQLLMLNGIINSKLSLVGFNQSPIGARRTGSFGVQPKSSKKGTFRKNWASDDEEENKNSSKGKTTKVSRKETVPKKGKSKKTSSKKGENWASVVKRVQSGQKVRGTKLLSSGKVIKLPSFKKKKKNVDKTVSSLAMRQAKNWYEKARMALNAFLKASKLSYNEYKKSVRLLQLRSDCTLALIYKKYVKISKDLSPVKEITDFRKEVKFDDVKETYKKRFGKLAQLAFDALFATERWPSNEVTADLLKTDITVEEYLADVEKDIKEDKNLPVPEKEKEVQDKNVSQKKQEKPKKVSSSKNSKKGSKKNLKGEKPLEKAR
jgi:septum formation inhibitor MinC